MKLISSILIGLGYVIFVFVYLWFWGYIRDRNGKDPLYGQYYGVLFIFFCIAFYNLVLCIYDSL